MGSAVALHLSVHFSMKSICENASECDAGPFRLGSSAQSGTSWKLPTFSYFFGNIVFSFEQKLFLIWNGQ